MSLVTIITATTARKSLADCIESVRNQTHKDIQHLIFVDDAKNFGNAIIILDEFKRKYSYQPDVIFLPYSVGSDRWNGHRMYAAGTYLASGKYVMFLDDDNWLDANHVEECLKSIESGPYYWAYSLRKIIDPNGVVVLDNCESLGPDYSTILHEKDHLVDVNCYFIEKNTAVAITPIWFRKAREPGVMEVDRAMCQLLNLHGKSVGTGKYTVNYTTGSTDLSVSSNFFLRGNAEMTKRYPAGFPWKK